MSGVNSVWCEGCFVRTVLGVQNLSDIKGCVVS